MILRAFAAFALLLALAAQAQAQESADALLDEVAATAEALEDASFLLTGYLIDADGTEIALELEVQTVPGERVASAYVLQPDALADNIVVLDGEAVYNYTFLTHQVTIFDADDPDALGGIVGADENEELDATFDLQKLFAGYDATVTGSADTPDGPATVVRLDNLEDEVEIVWVEAVVPEATLLPYRLTLHGPDDAVIAELVFEDLRTDQGLSAEEVAFLPDDAEVIDERESTSP